MSLEQVQDEHQGDDEDDTIRPLPDRLVSELTAVRTVALRNALAQDPGAAFIAVLHALTLSVFRSHGTHGCVQIGVTQAWLGNVAPDLRETPWSLAIQERHEQWAARLPDEPAALWDALTALAHDEQMALLAHCVSLGVNALFEPVKGYGGQISAHGIACRIAAADPHMSAYLTWLKQHRGATDETIRRYRTDIRRLMPLLGEPSQWDAAGLRSAFQRRSKETPGSASLLVTIMRSYIRFLVVQGECRPALLHAVPSVQRYRLSTLPRHVDPATIERIIAACPTDRPVEVRDKAIILLLARLGLRAADIQDMRLDDIDWRSGHLTVKGNANRTAPRSSRSNWNG